MKQEPQTVDPGTSATPGSRWKAGDKALHKAMAGAHVYVAVEDAERLGLRDGTDGWSIVEVVDGAPTVTLESD
jgi:hypothetical protein